VIEKQIIVNHCPAETRIALVEKEQVAELFVERHSARGLVGNIYKASILRVLPGMQSAFVDIGEIRSGFLYVNDVLNDEFIAQSRRLLAGTNDDLTHEEIEKRIKFSKIAIEKLLRDGQDILVQVSKEPMGSKGARLTMFVTLPGRYLVLSPYFDHVGISKKIDDHDERERLRGVFAPVKPENIAVIVRTAAKGVPAEILLREFEYLLSIWRDIQERFSTSSSPAVLHRDLDLTQRIIREQYSDDIGKVVIDDRLLYEKVKKFLAVNSPGAEEKTELYTGSMPLFDVYGIEMDIGRALSKKVELPNGGYLIVDQTEALTTFDVNTGRYVGRSNAAETVRITNLEAVKKVVSQLRLRNIGGIIIIDFIDMEDATDRERVYNALIEELKSDKARTNVLRISELGLVQMTRKRTSESLEQLLMETCPMCDGRGKVRSVITLAHDLLREIVRIHTQTGRTLLQVRVREDIRDWILEEERDWFQEIVDRWGLTVNFRHGELTVAAMQESPFEVNAE
jgi:ribonuclease G